MLECADCGNTSEFITERLYMHWVRIDGDAEILSVDEMQGDGSEGIEPSSFHTECGICNSTEVYDADDISRCERCYAPVGDFEDVCVLCEAEYNYNWEPYFDTYGDHDNPATFGPDREGPQY